MSNPGFANHLRTRKSSYPPILIREFVVAYLIGIASWAASIALSIALGIPFGLVAYPTIGFFLTRFATKRFEQGQLHWNWHTTSIGDLVRAKLAMLFGWPIGFPKLIGQLLVYRNL